jgi:hypothetical protein
MKFIRIKNIRINMDNVLYYEPTFQFLNPKDKWYKIYVYLKSKEYPLEFIFENEKIRDEYLHGLDKIFLF